MIKYQEYYNCLGGLTLDMVPIIVNVIFVHSNILCHTILGCVLWDYVRFPIECLGIGQP